MLTNQENIIIAPTAELYNANPPSTPFFKYPRVRIDDYIDRNVAKHELLCRLRDHRLVCVNGSLGIGKKYTVDSLAVFIEER